MLIVKTIVVVVVIVVVIFVVTKSPELWHGINLNRISGESRHEQKQQRKHT